MKLTGRLERAAPWGFLGLVVAVVFGLITLYAEFSHKGPLLTLEVADRTPVFSLREEIPGLEIFFRDSNLREEGLGLTLMTLRLVNDGDSAITPSDFDEADPLRIVVTDADLINAVLGESSSYFRKVFSQAIVSSESIIFPPMILDSSERPVLRLLALHPDPALPGVEVRGKIANVEGFRIVQLAEVSGSQIRVLSGGPLVHVMRFFFYLVVFILIVVFIFIFVSLVERVQVPLRDARRMRAAERWVDDAELDGEITWRLRQVLVALDGLSISNRSNTIEMFLSSGPADPPLEQFRRLGIELGDRNTAKELGVRTYEMLTSL